MNSGQLGAESVNLVFGIGVGDMILMSLTLVTLSHSFKSLMRALALALAHQFYLSR